VTGGDLRPSGPSGSQHPPVQDAELASAAEELYALPPGDFTAARDARVAAARAAGDRDLARAIGALRRPVVSAWLVNQLAREARDQVAGLVALGESLRLAQQDLSGDRLRELSVQRRQLVAGLMAEARRLAERDGRPAGLQVEREVEATLQAALADADAAAAVRAGCLASPLSYAGLGVGEADAVAVARRQVTRREPGTAPARDKAPAKERAQRPSGRRPAETPAEREARRATEAAERQARQAAAEAERRAAQIAEAEQAVRRATDAAAAAAADLEEAERQVASARAAQESARRLVGRFDKELSLAVAEESRANRAVRDAQRGKEAAERAADSANRRLARAETAARRLT
jgi:hypothetical protein